MRILFSNFVYYPESIGLRDHDLAAGLVKLGHKVDVITCLPSYPAGIVYKGYEGRANQWEVVDGVRIYRLPIVGDRSRSLPKRMIKFLFFSFLTVWVVLSQNISYDLVRVSQLALPGYLLNLLKKIPFHFDVQDMWPEWGKTLHFGISNVLYKILDGYQNKMYQKSDKITTITNGFKKYLEAKGVPSHKICVISNWAGFRDLKIVPRNIDFGTQEGLNGKFNIVYAGNIGIAQGVGVILQAAQILKNTPALQFIVIGNGSEKETLHTQANQSGIKTVRFLGQKSPDALADYFAWADALFLPLIKNPIYEVTIPSKTFTYLAYGRPILGAANGEVADLICRTACGIVVPSEDAQALATAILNLMGMTPQQREQFGKNALNAHQQYFDRDMLIRQYDQLIHSSVQ